jgi:hypothetical protein
LHCTHTPDGLERDFRNLGPPRKLAAAYRAFLQEQGEVVPNRTVPADASGQWREDSVRYDWVRRAHAWDVEMLLEHGRQFVVAFHTALLRATLKVGTAIENTDPASWSEILETIDALAKFIPPGAAAAVHDSRLAVGEEEPAPGPGDDAEKPRILPA